MSGKDKRKDELVDAATSVYQKARGEVDQQLAAMREEMESVRQESFAIGAIKAFDANIAQNEFMKILTLYRIKQAKDYKSGGLTWKEFCDSLGVPDRTIDRMIEDARPLFESFSANLAEICGMPFNKIRLLGRSVSANLAEIQNNCLIYGEESIPLTPEYRDDIQALIERIGEDAKEKVDEAEAKLSAKDKVLKSKQDLLNKQERDLKKFERETAKRGLSPEEDALLGKIDELGIVFNGHCLQLENVFAALEENPIPSAVAAFASLMDNVRARVSAMRESTILGLAPEGMYPDDEWKPKIQETAAEE